MASCSRVRKACGADAVVDIGGDHAAEQRRHVGDKSEQRQGDDQRQKARQDQHLHRRHAHHAQGVDLLAHLHRAEFGGDRRARAARDHDRGEQHAEFAQHQNADQVDGEGRGAEAAQLENALLRHDAADQEIDGDDDRHRAQARNFRCGRPSRSERESAGLNEHPQRADGEFAEKGDAADRLSRRGIDAPLAEPDQQVDERRALAAASGARRREGRLAQQNASGPDRGV